VILTDSDVTIDFSKGRDLKLMARLPTLPVVACGVTRAEVLHGARTPVERQKLLTVLNAFHPVPIPEPLWDLVGDNLATLRAAGIAVPFADAVLATLGIYLGVEVWSRDRHFPLIQSVLPALKLFQEPP
jgi:predicted nucleic acid-binding protein